MPTPDRPEINSNFINNKLAKPFSKSFNLHNNFESKISENTARYPLNAHIVENMDLKRNSVKSLHSNNTETEDEVFLKEF